MGSIAVDKAISKLGTPGEFYQQLEPEQIAEHIVTVFRPEIPQLVDDVMRQDHPRLWRDLPGPVRTAVVERVQAQLPSVVGRVTDEIGIHIDQLLDPKIMVIDHFRANPSLVVRIFRDFGQRELNLMVAFGFVFGFLLGIPVAFVDHAFGQWWLLPVLGVVVGWLTNALGMWLIFEPPEPRRILGITRPRPLPAPPGRGRGGLRPDHRRRRDHPRADRRLPARRTARRPHPVDAGDRAAAGDRQGGRAGAGRGAGGGRPGPLRHDPRLGRPRGRRPHADAVPGPRVQPASGREDPGPGGHPDQGAAAARLRRDDAGRDQGGRVDAVRPRRDHGTRRGLPAPVAVRGERMTDDPSSPTASPIGPAVDALPGLARVAASAWWHTTEWGVRTSARAGRRVVRAVADPAEAAALARDATGAASVLGELARSVSAGVPLRHGPDSPRASRSASWPSRHRPPNGRAPHPPTLRERGAELLERSRDVWNDDVAHPAYERILDELAPDEARVLLLLLEGGPQPSVDVRTGGPVGMVNSQLVAPGLTMIGARAGCRHLDQVPSYLNNLFRLGLVWFSREALRDPLEYQVVEAQPDVLAAMHSVKFAKVVRRSIHLTPFGEDFCRTCLVDEDVGRGGAVPRARRAAGARAGRHGLTVAAVRRSRG